MFLPFCEKQNKRKESMDWLIDWTQSIVLVRLLCLFEQLVRFVFYQNIVSEFCNQILC